MGLANQGRVSVVIPCYNSAVFIAETIQSVLDQTYPVDEILVIDDGSTDSTSQIAAQFGSPVKVVRQVNQGESVARNHGMDLSTGDWIAFLDSDDLWFPTKIEEQLSSVTPSAIGIYTDFSWFGLKSGVENVGKLYVSDTDLMRIARGSGVFISSLLLRSSVKTRFPEWTRHGEDTLFYMDLATEGRLDFVNQCLVQKREHGRCQTRRSDMDVLWHRSFSRWIELRQSLTGNEVAVRLQQLYDTRLVDTCYAAWLHGDYERVASIAAEIRLRGIADPYRFRYFLRAPFQWLLRPAFKRLSGIADA